MTGIAVLAHPLNDATAFGALGVFILAKKPLRCRPRLVI